MDGDGLFIMAVSGVYGYHASKAGPKCTLVWVASCFAIPPSLTVRHLGTWDKIPDQLCRLEHDSENDNVMPRMLTHADLHSESGNTDNYRLSPDHGTEQWIDHQSYEDEQNDSKFEDPVDEYLAEYANLISSREKEEDEINTQSKQMISTESEKHQMVLSETEETSVETHVEHSNRGETHEERRRTFSRRKSCSDASGKMSLSLSVAQEQTVDDLHVDKTTSPTAKPEKFSLKNITAMARRMSVPILDKSEDVDHGTKIYGETLIKKNRSTKQFREAFSEEHDDYIPHRAPKTLSKSLTTSEIEHVCDELKTDTPGSFKNVVTELKLRTSDYNDNSPNKEDIHHHDSDISGPKLTKYPTTTTVIDKENNNGKIESPISYRNVVKELQDRKDGHVDHHNDLRLDRSDSLEGSSLNHSFADSYTSETSSPHNSLRRNRAHEVRPHHLNSPRTNRTNNYSRDETGFSKTSPVRDSDDHSSGSSTPRTFRDHHEGSTQHTLAKHKSEEPVSDFMRKLNNLTAQTRLATRPSLGNIEGYDPSPSSAMLRSQSVMNVSSPLSPKHERSLLSSSLSSSASSSSDIPVLSYHDVVDPCYRCWKTVYSLDKMGPIRKVLYHKQCFRCVVCNTLLSLNNYRQNINDKTDVQVYCKKHVPSQESPHIGLEAKNLNVMMHHPKLDSVNPNVRGTKEDRRKSQNLTRLSVGRAVSTPRLDLICSPNENNDSNGKSTLDKNGNVSLRELKMDETPKSVWTRSTFSAAKLDLNVPASGRKGSSLYRTVDSWNYL